MRIIVIAAVGLGLAGAAMAQTPPADPKIVVKPGWLSSKAAKPAPTWMPMNQWRACIAALAEPGEDKAKQAALSNYRALYFQHSVGQAGLDMARAEDELAAVDKPPATLAASCLKSVPQPYDRAFRAAHPWATSYFDAARDREMFTPVASDDPAPETVAVPATP
jgi:hypothetical protein